MADWEKQENGTGFGYPDWALAIARQKFISDGAEFSVVPAYLELTVHDWVDWRNFQREMIGSSQNWIQVGDEAVKQIISSQDEQKPKIRVDIGEFQHLALEIALAVKFEQDNYTDGKFRLIAMLPYGSGINILNVGQLGALTSEGLAEHAVSYKILALGQPLPPSLVAGFSSTGYGEWFPNIPLIGQLPIFPTVAAIIDDGVPYLSSRTREIKPKESDATRFLGVWLQADHRSIGSVSQYQLGRVLDQGKINGLLHRAEAETYRRINRELWPITEQHSSDHASSHGAFVLDAAAGAEPEDAKDLMRDTSLLAVQLPPAAIRDSSGQQNEFYALWGLRWIVKQAVMAAFMKCHRPGNIVTTLTIGSLAGPGDETAWLAEGLSETVARYNTIGRCLNTHARLFICCAYGNARRERLVARQLIKESTPLELDWRVQPDDHSSSFVELRVEETQAKNCTLYLSHDKANFPSIPVCFDLAPGSYYLLTGLRGPIAGIFRLAEKSGYNTLLVALAPTAGDETMALAPSGTWHIKIENSAATECRATARVQRDDTPTGYRLLGRQSWLTHENDRYWDPETGDWSGVTGNYAICPISHEGTAVGHAGATGTIWFVGASYPAKAGACTPRIASPYSAEGANPHSSTTRQGSETDGPDCNALAEDGANMPGRRGRGMLSGQTARISGTSVAAPALARWILVMLQKENPKEDPATGGGRDPAPDLPAKAPTKNLRLGFGTVPGQAPFQSADELRL